MVTCKPEARTHDHELAYQRIGWFVGWRVALSPGVVARSMVFPSSLSVTW